MAALFAYRDSVARAARIPCIAINAMQPAAVRDRGVARMRFFAVTSRATMEEAAVLSIFIERAARMQLIARAVGPIHEIEPAFAREAHDYRLKPKAVGATFHDFARRVLRKGGEVLE